MQRLGVIDGGAGRGKSPAPMARRRDEEADAELKAFAKRLDQVLGDVEGDDRFAAERFTLESGVPAITRRSYRLAEREPGILAVKKLAIAAGVSVDFLLGLTDDPSPRNAPKKKKAANG